MGIGKVRGHEPKKKKEIYKGKWKHVVAIQVEISNNFFGNIDLKILEGVYIHLNQKPKDKTQDFFRLVKNNMKNIGD